MTEADDGRSEIAKRFWSEKADLDKGVALFADARKSLAKIVEHGARVEKRREALIAKLERQKSSDRLAKHWATEFRRQNFEDRAADAGLMESLGEAEAIMRKLASQPINKWLLDFREGIQQ